VSASQKKKSGKSELREQRERWRRAAAAVIAATRRDKDVTQVEFGDRMGWSHDTVASVESGRRKIEIGDLVMAAVALNEDPNTLVQRVRQWNVRDRRMIGV
jgi:transcriptional regulator with XRE-family HTH domain